MSHREIYRQPVPGNLQEDMPFTFHCSHTLLVDRRTLLKKWPLCDKSGPVACTAVGYLQIASKSCLVWQGPKENKHYGSVVAKRLRASNSNSGVSDQQSVGSNPQPWHLCPLKARHLTIASSFRWDVKPLSHVLCYTCKRTQCTYRKEEGFAPVFLAVAALCAVAPCKPL